MGLKENIEAIIFLGGEGVKIKEISKSFSLSLLATINILNELKENRKNTGINIEFGDEMVYFVTNPHCGEAITNFYEQESKPKKLSGAALETVSIIAYKQPVTKSEIEAIRGVSTDRIIQTLEGKKFIQICGRKETPGRPNLYQITSNFLAYLDISKVEELPNYYEMRGNKNGKNEN
ncbi:MAG: SMC-Scp complex subunit ScpB [Fusobacteriaceae bacterium]